MEQVKFLLLLIVGLHNAKGFIWNSIATLNSSCVGNSISLAWNYTLDSGEILQQISWTKSNEAGGPILLADYFGGFTAYVGRVTRLLNAGILLSNAVSSDNGTYIVSVTLTSGFIHSMNVTFPVHEIANASCIPTCDSSSNCQIPHACPVQNYIDAVKYPNGFKCSLVNNNKQYRVCAEGDAVTSCYNGSSLCRSDTCIGTACQLVLGLSLGLGLGIQCLYIFIIILIFICTGYKHARIFGLVLGLGVGIIFHVSWIIIVIIIYTGTTSCIFELGLGLGLGTGVPCVIVYIIAMIFKKCKCSLFKDTTTTGKFCKGTIKVLHFASGIGIIVELKCTNDEENPKETDGTNDQDDPEETDEVPSVQTCVGSDANFNFTLTEDPKASEVLIKTEAGCAVMIVHGKLCINTDPSYKDRVNFTGNTNQKLISFILRNVTLNDTGKYLAVLKNPAKTIGSQMLIVKDAKGKTKTPGPPAVHIGTQNKVDPNSRPVNGRLQPLPPSNTGFEDTPKYRPQPQPPQNGEIKDRNLRGISATFGDTLDLASETPRPIRLTPLTPKQETVQEEVASEKPKKKRKNKKKKDQMTEKTPEDENGGTV